MVYKATQLAKTQSVLKVKSFEIFFTNKNLPRMQICISVQLKKLKSLSSLNLQTELIMLFRE